MLEYSIREGDGNDVGADGKHNKVNRQLWIPELGNYGKFKFGASYDVTNAGLQIYQKELLLNMVNEAFPVIIMQTIGLIICL